MANIKRIDNTFFDDGDIKCTRVKITGNIVEVRKSTYPSYQKTIKIDKDHYLVLGVGQTDLSECEVREYSHNTSSRADNVESVRKTMAVLRDIINTNCIDLIKTKFITLTYRENMQDAEKLYADLKKFHMRLRYYLRNNNPNNSNFEYISVIEPQNRGAFHAHEILIFNYPAPFIANEKIAELWGHGFTKTTKIKNDVTNIGLYLTAYLSDIDITQATASQIKSAKNIKDVITYDENGEQVPKRILKGARLHLYPKGIKIYRCSRGVKRPTVFYCSAEKAEDITRDMRVVYEKTLSVSDSQNQIINTFNYKQYKG